MHNSFVAKYLIVQKYALLNITKVFNKGLYRIFNNLCASEYVVDVCWHMFFVEYV